MLNYLNETKTFIMYTHICNNMTLIFYYNIRVLSMIISFFLWRYTIMKNELRERPDEYSKDIFPSVPSYSLPSLLYLLPSAIAEPFNRYFIVKSQKELAIRRMENYAETRKYILYIIDHLASIGKLTPSLQSELMQSYYDTFKL